MATSLDPQIEKKLLQATHEIMLEEHFIRDAANAVHKRILQIEATGSFIDEIATDGELIAYLLGKLKNLLVLESQFSEAFASILGTEYAFAFDDLLTQFLQQWLGMMQQTSGEPDVSDYIYFADMEEQREQFRSNLEATIVPFFESLQQGGV